MREGGRSNSRRKLVSSESPVRTPSRRTEPKPLPLLTSNLSYSAYLRYQDVNTKDIPKTSTKKRQQARNSRLQRKESERYKDENVVVVNDNAVKHSADDTKKNKNNLNPFHHDFNKVIENPFIRAQEMSLSTEITDDLPDTASDSSSLSMGMWEVARGATRETVNTAIVDIYDSDEGCDPFLKMRVVVISSVLLLQVVSGFSRMLTQLNFLLVSPPSAPMSASLVSLPLHMQLLGSLSSTLVLPLLLHWSRIKSLSVCCLLFIVTSILVIFTEISWMFRLTEFLSGFASGLTLPLMHIYSSEVFTPKRRTKFALVISFLHTLGEMIAAVVGYFFTIEGGAWLNLALCVPCLVSASCFAPDSPRLLLIQNDKTSCVDSLQWMRGSLSDLAGEFSTMSSRLENALGSSSLLPSIRHRAVYVPILLCLMIVSLSSLNCSQNFSLLFITNFTGTSLRIDLVLVIISVKMLGTLIAIILHAKIGIKMILSLGLALSSAVSLFLALLSHLTWVGGAGGGAGLTSLAILGLMASLTSGPLMLTSTDLAPVRHIPWALSLTSAILYSADLITVMMFPIAMEDLSLSLSVMSWVASLCLALAYVITLWLLPDIKEPQVGQMEEYFRLLFDRSRNVKLTSSSAVTDI